MILCLVCLPESGWAKQRGVRKGKKTAAPAGQSKEKPKKQPTETPSAQIPAQPPKPEDLPATPPAVIYEQGQLTITAKNSTLSDILDAVQTETGAVIDVPPGAEERVVGQIGPGPARDVLASLLNGSHFNYVMVGSETDTSAVQRVILTAKAGGETPPGPVVAQQPRMLQPAFGGRPFRMQRLPQPQVQVPTADTDDSDAMEQEDSSQDSVDEDMQDQNAAGDQRADPNQPVVKTPEQLLMELQRQQQLMQQQQQQQAGQPQAQPPQVGNPNPNPQEEKPPH